MTKEEAIRIIENRDGIMDYCENQALSEALDMAIEALGNENYERVWITDGKRQGNILYDKSRQLYWTNCYTVEFAKKVLKFEIIDGEGEE